MSTSIKKQALGVVIQWLVPFGRTHQILPLLEQRLNWLRSDIVDRIESSHPQQQQEQAKKTLEQKLLNQVGYIDESQISHIQQRLAGFNIDTILPFNQVRFILSFGVFVLIHSHRKTCPSVCLIVKSLSISYKSLSI